MIDSSVSPPLTARQLAKSLLPHLAEDTANGAGLVEEFLLWPPDLFAFTSLILSVTGAYHLVISPPRYKHSGDYDRRWPPHEEWASDIRRIGIEWRDLLAKHYSSEAFSRCKERSEPERGKVIREKVGQLEGGKWMAGDWIPQKVGDYWKDVFDEMSPEWDGNVMDILCSEDTEQDSDKLKRHWKAVSALVSLHAIADEACVGWGIRNIAIDGALNYTRGTVTSMSVAQKDAEILLDKYGTLATINNQRGRVLPKRHNPGVGITLRSLSSNLAFHRSSVDVRWITPTVKNKLSDRMRQQEKILTVLLLPWPLKISASDFKVENPQIVQVDREQYGFFSYSPAKSELDGDKLSAALDVAQEETENIDMVILPECALNKTQDVNTLERVLGKYGVSAYVAGVRHSPRIEEERRFNDNMVYFKMGTLLDGNDVKFPSSEDSENQDFEIQHKHHRWKLDRNQITNYSLGSILSPGKDWWEAIKIKRRKVTFINVAEELTICPLICEDLARQDPIADLIRTVGPSLVITILMDGPQKKERWSARYASVLGEDPGSAVITLTSFGMVDRWRHSFQAAGSRVVALWNDGKGSEREIELEKGSVGILLSRV
jgi:hypothetical protein